MVARDRGPPRGCFALGRCAKPSLVVPVVVVKPGLNLVERYRKASPVRVGPLGVHEDVALCCVLVAEVEAEVATVEANAGTAARI